MHTPTLAGAFYLTYVMGLLPLSAWRTSQRFEAARASALGGAAAVPWPTRSRLYASTLFSLAFLFYLSFICARELNIDLFVVPKFGLREVAWCVAFGIVSWSVGMASRWLRSEKERRNMPLVALVPQTRQEGLVFALVAIAAGVSEEAAYRGMVFIILSYVLGSAMAAALLSALAFALAHRLQGWKSMGVVFIKGLLMQGLVQITATLIGAMVLHALLDMLTAWQSYRRLSAMSS